MTSEDFPFEHFLKKPSLENPLAEGLCEKKTKLPTSENKDVQSDLSTNELELINSELLKHLSKSITRQKYNTYFENNFDLTGINENKVTFNVPTNFIKNIIQQQFLDLLKKALKDSLGNKKFQIEILANNNASTSQMEGSRNSPKSTSLSPHAPLDKKTVKENIFTLDLEPTKEDLMSTVESKYINHMENDLTGSIIDPSKTFTNFIVGHSNQLAFATAIAVAKNPGKQGKYPSLYIHSNSGLGKTHLLHAVANGIKEQFPQLRICLTTARNFLKEMVEYIKDNSLDKFQKKYTQKVDVLMIDDIHELKNKKGTQDEFFHIFNELYNKGKQLIFTSDKSPSEIDGIPERIKTRLQWGLVIDIQKPDIETRIAILKKKTYELDLFLSDDILTSIATSIKSNIRELEGSLIKLSAFSDVMNVDIDIEMVKDLLMLNNYEEAKEITLDDVAKITSSFYKIPLADIKSKARSKDIARARHVAMYLSRKIINATQQEIGTFFGGRDHTSVIHGVNKITSQVKIDVGLSRDIIQIENNL